MYQAVTKKIVNRDANGVGYADYGRKAGLCSAGLNVPDVGRGQPRFFRNVFLLHIGFDPGDLDPFADCLVIKFPLHEAPPPQQVFIMPIVIIVEGYYNNL